MPDLKLCLLGSPRIERHGTDLQVETRKAIALAAYLAVTGRPQRRERLAALFWPESEQSRARGALRYTLSVLKTAIGGEHLDADRETIALIPDDSFWIDVDRFRSRLAECHTHDHGDTDVCQACVEPLTAAARLYQDDFLAGFTLSDSLEFDEWQFFETESLRREMSEALERLVRAHADAGDHDTAIDYARRLVALDPLHEPAHRQLMRLYAQAGRRTAALRQYEECVRILDDELDVAPAPGTIALNERIKTGDLRLRPEKKRPEAHTPRHNLPKQLTSFVGREGELDAIATRLRDEDCRLLTLLGPGGIGKTRLAIEAGRRLLDDFPHGVFFVSLAPLRSADELVPAIATAVGFSFYTGDAPPMEQLLRYLRHKEMLVILDNFEHLRAGAGLLIEILRETRNLTLLVTSREHLNLQAEWVLSVDGLQYAGSDTDASAIRLFLDRSRQAQPAADESADLAAVTEVCRLVDGMPLAIELAAAWTTVLSLADIAKELGDSLDLLTTTAPDMPARHQSMRAVFESTWRRLTEPEQRALRQFSVFRGGCDRTAAERVTSATLPILMALVHKSTLRRDPDSGRFEIHEVLRQYAAEKVAALPDERAAIRERHARYYTTVVQRRESDLKGTRQQQALAEIEAEQDNVRGAWAWALETGRSVHLARSMEGLGHFYERRLRFQEGESFFRDAVAHLENTTESETRILAHALVWHGTFSHALGDTAGATRQIQRSLGLLDTRPQSAESDRLRAFVLLTMGGIVEHSDRDAAENHYTRSLSLHRQTDNLWGAAKALRGLGRLAWHVGRYDDAERYYRKSLSTSEAIGDDSGLAEALNLLALVSKNRGEFEMARRMQRRSLAIHRRAGNRQGVVDLEEDLASTLLWEGKFSDARLLLESSLSARQETEFTEGIAYCLGGLGRATRHLGEYESARAFLQESLRRWEEIGNRRGMGWANENLGAVALAEKRYVDAAQLLQSALNVNRGINQRVFEGSTLAKLAYVARIEAEYPKARRYLTEALNIASDIRGVFPLFPALPAAALLFADRGETVRAVELYAFATYHFGFVRNSRWFADVAGRHIKAVKATLPADVITEAEERGRARDLWETVAELLEELRQRE